MDLLTLRRVPWTCCWGHFGVPMDQGDVPSSTVENLFWACSHPGRDPGRRRVKAGECETCASWEPLTRLPERAR